ncbi:MAG: hypothetical protein AB7Q97_21060 [Gammaproteobacteria bacterium]
MSDLRLDRTWDIVPPDRGARGEANRSAMTGAFTRRHCPAAWRAWNSKRPASQVLRLDCCAALAMTFQAVHGFNRPGLRPVSTSR